MNVPKLRFRGFDIEWNTIDLKNIFNYFSTNSLSRDQLSSNGKVKNIHYGDIHKKFPTIVDVEKNVNTYIKDINYINKYELCKNGDLIFADASEDYDGIGKVIEIINIDCDTISGLHTIMARDIKDIFAPKYKGYYFNSPVIHNQLRIMANGFKVYGISKDNIGKLNAKIPSKEEQFKIAKTLELLDRKIELQTKKIEDLKLFKSYTKNQLFSNGDKIVKLKDILIKWNEKNKDGSINYVESISNKYGFISQSDQFEDRNVASKDLKNYYVIRKNVFGYNPSRLNVGSLALKENDNTSVVSPLYECFTTTQNNKFMLEWFNSKYFKKGTLSKFEGGVRNTLNFTNLCEIEINLPCLDKQNEIANYLYNFDKKIQLEELKLNKLNEMKKGLMQSMFV